MKEDIRDKFYKHFSTLSKSALAEAVVEIADNSTYDDLLNVTEAVLEKMNAECKNASCTYSNELKVQVLNKLGKVLELKKIPLLKK